MSARVTWTNLVLLQTNLEQMPERLQVQGDRITRGWASDAAFRVRSVYGEHRVTGNLQKGVTVEKIKDGYKVQNRAHHAHLFEFGTRGGRRRSYTGTDTLGRVFTAADRGPMPGANIFIPTMIRARNAMRRDLAGLLRREGFAVILTEIGAA